YAEDDWPSYFGVGIYGRNPDGSAEGTDDICYSAFSATSYIENAANDHEFHVYTIKYDGLTNKVEFYRDNIHITTLTASERPYDEVPLLIAGRDYSNTNYLDWIRVSPLLKYEHDIAVTNLQIAPRIAGLYKPVYANATIKNQGFNDENNIVIEFHINETLANSSTISSIASGNIKYVNFTWIPTQIGNYTLKVRAVPFTGENDTTNNELAKIIEVKAYPDVWISPTEFNITVTQGRITNYTLIIGNNGFATLDFEFIKLTAENYTYSNVSYELLEGVIGGTDLSLADDSYATLTLPFTFNFYGENYTAIYICSNGWISFSYAASNSPPNITLPIVGWPNTIFVLGTDWNPDAGGGVYVKSLTNPNRYVITWYQVPHYSLKGNNTFQIVLYENGMIRFNYQRIETPYSFVVGLNKGDGIYGTHYISSENYMGIPANSSSLQFVQIGYEWLNITPMNGAVSVGRRMTITVSINATALELGWYNLTIILINNDPTKGNLKIPLRVEVVANQLPIARACVDKDFVSEHESLQFSAFESYDPDGHITNYTWEFGDGNISYGMNVSHAYSVYGISRATLIIRDDKNGIGRCFITISVNALPRISINITPQQAYTYESITFNISSYDPDGKILLYAWDFDGDGVFDWYSTESKNFSWYYSKSGNYNATAKVTDDNLTSTKVSVLVTIKNRVLIANFTFSPARPKVTDRIQFSDTSIDLDGSIVAWLWDFGDGTNSTLQSPTYKYAKRGSYLVSLTVWDNDGASATFSTIIVIVNSQPILSNSTKTPETGDEKTEFVFSVTYTDADGDEAKYIVIVIDGKAYNMMKVSGNPLTGAVYEYRTKLSSGTHQYNFECDDGSGEPLSTASTTTNFVDVKKEDRTWLLYLALIVMGVIIAVETFAIILLRKRGK
ncbi:MAG: PKD domain-containing protein, partial [Candidatus Thermoplasmatota archaeon]